MGRSPRGPSGAADGPPPYRSRTLAPARRAGGPARPPPGAHGGSALRAARALALAAALALLPAAVLPAPAGGADPPVPAAVAGRFEAVSDGATVQLAWSVPAESQAVGFQLLRALQRDGPYAPVNPWLIPATPNATYAFADLAVDPGATYHYQLEAVDAAGHKVRRGPLTIAVMPEEFRALEPPAGGGRPAGGGFPAGGTPPPAPGAPAGGGWTAVQAGVWGTAAGLVLLLAAALVRLRRRGRRVPPGPPVG